MAWHRAAWPPVPSNRSRLLSIGSLLLRARRYAQEMRRSSGRQSPASPTTARPRSVRRVMVEWRDGAHFASPLRHSASSGYSPPAQLGVGGSCPHFAAISSLLQEDISGVTHLFH